MKKWLKMIKNEKGLTLIELLAVVVILGIIAAIAIPSISGIIDNSKKDAHVSNALMIISTAKLAVASNDEITKDIETTGVSLAQLEKAGYLDAIPKDPDGKDGSTYTPTSNVKYINKVYYINLNSASRDIGNKTESELVSKGREIFEK